VKKKKLTVFRTALRERHQKLIYTSGPILIKSPIVLLLTSQATFWRRVQPVRCWQQYLTRASGPNLGVISYDSTALPACLNPVCVVISLQTAAVKTGLATAMEVPPHSLQSSLNLCKHSLYSQGEGIHIPRVYIFTWRGWAAK